MLGTGKHQHLLPVAFADKLRQQFTLAVLVNEMDVLGDLLWDAVLRRATSTSSGLCSSFSARPLISSEKVAENSGFLSTRRQFGQYATDVSGIKPCIQHTVRFVQHEGFQLYQD